MNRTLTKIALTPDELCHICLCTHSSAERFATHLNNAMEYYDINTPARVAMFLSQVSYNSFRFVYTEVNFGLSTRQLMALYPALFPTPASCEGYALNPKALANRLYGNKFGNNVKEDCWTYRPRGLWRMVGKSCYESLQEGLGLAVMGDGAGRIAEPQGAAWSSAWYWCKHKLNMFADKLDLTGALNKLADDPTNTGLYPDQLLDDRIEMWEYTQLKILEIIDNEK